MDVATRSPVVDMAEFDDEVFEGLQSSPYEARQDEPGGRKLFPLIFYRRGELLYGVLLYGEGYRRLASHDNPPTVIVNNKAITLPKPDKMLYVLGPSLRLDRVELCAAIIDHHLEHETMDQFYKSENWRDKLQPVLKAHEWIECPQFN